MHNGLLRFVGLAAVVSACLPAWGGTPPIEGPDDFEPDDSPLQARWAPMFDEGTSFSRPAHRHNFNRSGDVDWVVFRAIDNLFVFVRTTGLFYKSDTFLSVYRYYAPGVPVPSQTRPEECEEDVITLPDGANLLPVACNDDFNEGTRRSEVSFDVGNQGGLFFARVQYSKKPPQKDGGEKGGEGEGEAPDEGAYTTYNFEAAYFGVVPGSLVASVVDADTLADVNTAIVRVDPIGMTITESLSGVYVIGSLPEDTYQVRVEAPGYLSASQSKYLSGGGLQSVDFALERAPDKHSLDYQEPAYKITLSELLRLIQFYNSGGYHCDPETEDNFGPGIGSHGCPFHNADYNPGNWLISLTEILRLIQFYNSGGYYACEGGEDGFCPGEQE